MHYVLALLVLLSACQKKEPEDNRTPVEAKLDESGSYPVVKAATGLEYHTGLVHGDPELKNLGDSHAVFTDCGALPDSFDLRTLGVVPPVKDQGSCGSCWSFSKTGSLESALMGQGKNLDLSEQEMVSCDNTQWGCNGGLLSGYKYQINHGQGLEAAFPYTARDSACKSIPVAAKGVRFQYVGTADRGPSEQELKCALFKYKTIPWITVGATNAWGNPPASEKTPYTRCGATQTNHAVGVVGWWKDSTGKTQFIMKNSWGTGWGDKGYMSLPLGCNSFGEEVAFIEVEKAPEPEPTPVPPGPTPVPPCDRAPKVKLPAEVQVFAGVEVMVGVQSEPGVAYSWSLDGNVFATTPTIMIAPPKDAVYKLSGKNACATTESQVRLRIVMSK